MSTERMSLTDVLETLVSIGYVCLLAWNLVLTEEQKIAVRAFIAGRKQAFVEGYDERLRELTWSEVRELHDDIRKLERGEA